MLRIVLATFSAFLVALTVMAPASAFAHGKHAKMHRQVHAAGPHRVTVARLFPIRRKPQVAGFVQRSGGYSYIYADTLRMPEVADQGGPFDSGFFFRSNVETYGSRAPYLN